MSVCEEAEVVVFGAPRLAQETRWPWTHHVVASVLLLQAACTDAGLSPSALPAAPPLPLTGTVIRVRTADDLRRAALEAHADTTIVLESGRYALSEPLRIDAAANAALANIALRGASGARKDVIIEGAGIDIGNAQGVQIADVTFRDLSVPAIHARGEAGASRVHVYNVRFENIHAPTIRATAPADSAEGVADGVVEHSDFEYENVAADDDGWSAIVVYGGSNWTIRYNRFLNIRAGAKARARFRPAVVVRAGARDTHTHNNLFLDCDRPIAYGIEEHPDGSPDHNGGSIYNNFIYRRRGLRGDAGIILWAAADTKVYHNTIIQNGTYQRAIEYRFKATTGLDIRNNLTDDAIAGRDDAHATVAANYMRATLAMFRSPRAGDLRLLPTAEQAIDRGVPLAGWAFGWDGKQRPFGPRPDIGADEFIPARRE